MSSFVHVVFFTCRPGTSDAEVDTLCQDAREMLTPIPTVRHLTCGRRDMTIQRPVSDLSFHVGLTVIFEDRAGYDVYAGHPFHTAFVDKHKDLWAQVRVFDYHDPQTQAP